MVGQVTYYHLEIQRLMAWTCQDTCSVGITVCKEPGLTLHNLGFHATILNFTLIKNYDLGRSDSHVVFSARPSLSTLSEILNPGPRLLFLSRIIFPLHLTLTYHVIDLVILLLVCLPPRAALAYALFFSMLYHLDL